ncbi:hypothetical protein [Tahibacter sp.]|uniref:hypothetical protein n=1 Tax=Tahibacter sp. TaxID=2056211 RepID=UPI0028C3FE4E|nr:hypothetical protein [Tahibacter sp.]
MSNPITQAIAGLQQEGLAHDSSAATVETVPILSAGHTKGSQRLWSRTSFSVATAGRAFGQHNPTARVHSDVSTQF